jgi:hypothetical protein
MPTWRPGSGWISHLMFVAGDVLRLCRPALHLRAREDPCHSRFSIRRSLLPRRTASWADSHRARQRPARRNPYRAIPRIDMTGATPHRLNALAGRQAHGWARPPMHACRLYRPGQKIFPRQSTGHVALPSILPRHTSIHHGCENLVCSGSTSRSIWAMTGLRTPLGPPPRRR